MHCAVGGGSEPVLPIVQSSASELSLNQIQITSRDRSFSPVSFFDGAAGSVSTFVTRWIKTQIKIHSFSSLHFSAISDFNGSELSKTNNPRYRSVRCAA
jgi:hypothetical protein